MADSNAVYYYHYDGLGSIVALSDVNNVLVERYSYDVFGQPTIRDVNGTEIAESALANPYLFTGRAWDPETALYYYRARYYDYFTGRFLQPDPTGYADGINWYAYCGNNPASWADPYGLCKDNYMPTAGEWAGAIVGGIGEGLYNTFLDPFVAVGDYYGNFRDTGMGRFSSGASALNMGVGKVVGYSTLLEGMLGIEARSVRLTSGWERAGQIGIGGVQTAFSAVAAAELLHAARTPSSTATLHGNNLNTTKPAQGYTLRNRDTGEILKYGETTLGKRRYTNKFLSENNAEIVFEASGTKRQMHAWNHEQILNYKAAHSGARPPLNKTDW